MLREGKSIANYESQSLIAKGDDWFNSAYPVFILCGKCYWCATYFDKTRLPMDNNCPRCNTNHNNELSVFSIATKEASTFDLDDKLGIKIEKMV
jgi:hypothetical protein